MTIRLIGFIFLICSVSACTSSEVVYQKRNTDYFNACEINSPGSISNENCKLDLQHEYDIPNVTCNKPLTDSEFMPPSICN